MKYEKTSPTHSGCAEIPIRTNVIDVLSKSERGLSADRMPIGIAIMSQTSAPPNTSEAVTGAAHRILRVRYRAIRFRLRETAGRGSARARRPASGRYFRKKVFRSALALAGWKRYPPTRLATNSLWFRLS